MKPLEEGLKNLPDAPGIYQYFDKEGHLLYIGKAKNLKSRIKSYFRLTPAPAPAANLGARIAKMIAQTRSLEYILVDSEHDALILENSLIKQLRPKYNILLRDDKTYPYIYIDLGADFPRPKITRKVITGKNIRYFGPFSTGARDILDAIYDIVPLVQKEGCQAGKKACLFHQIGKCLAPCEGKITKEEYYVLINQAISLLSDKTKLVALLEAKMTKLSEALRFEEAAILRDKISKIKKSIPSTPIDLAAKIDLDIFAIDANEKKGVVVRLFMREGKIVSSSHTLIGIQEELDKNEAYKRALLEFYTADVPFVAKTILVAESFEEQSQIEEVLFEKFGKRIFIEAPKRGKKRNLVEIALKNAATLLALEEGPQSAVLEEIRDLFNLSVTPRRIEIFDNSHLQGQTPVGAMVVFEDGSFKKESYRHYNLSFRDEYSQMREMLTRRIESFKDNPPPDLWIIDGGATLLKLAKDLLNSYGTSLDVIAIAKEKIDAKAHRAKGSAKDRLFSQEGAILLPSTDRRLQFIQRLRDEAHRFALDFHRRQKIKADTQIALLEASGIGEAAVKKLLLYFGTFEKIRDASPEELSSLIGPKKAAMLISHRTRS